MRAGATWTAGAGAGWLLAALALASGAPARGPEVGGGLGPALGTEVGRQVGLRAGAAEPVARLSAAPAEVAIGQPIEWTLRVVHPAESSVLPPAGDPAPDDTWLLLDGPRRRTEQDAGGARVTTVTWTVMSLVAGERSLPELALRFDDGSELTARGGRVRCEDCEPVSEDDLRLLPCRGCTERHWAARRTAPRPYTAPTHRWQRGRVGRMSITVPLQTPFTTAPIHSEAR